MAPEEDYDKLVEAWYFVKEKMREKDLGLEECTLTVGYETLLSMFHCCMHFTKQDMIWRGMQVIWDHERLDRYAKFKFAHTDIENFPLVTMLQMGVELEIFELEVEF